MAIRLPPALLAATFAVFPSTAPAQSWILEAGVTARGEYSDNYFLSATSPESAFTGTVSPFVSLVRRTETSDVTGLFAVGGNKVWGLPDSTEFLSANLGLKGTLRQERSTWTGNASFVRAPSLQEVSRPTGIVLALAYTNTAVVEGGYEFAVTDRWSVGPTAGWINNSYDAVPGSVGANELSDNDQYSVGGNLRYLYSEHTQFTFAVSLSRYDSDVTRTDSISPTIGVVHAFSPRLTVSASLGGFWSDTRLTQAGLVCPTTPILCDTGVVQRVPVSTSVDRRDSGPLYGGSVAYGFSESTKFEANLSETLSPGSAGVLTRTDAAGASLSHRFSERLTGRLGAAYTRTKIPAGLTAESTSDYYQGEVGVSYLLAERWSLDAGYRYSRANYSQNPFEPDSNVVFVSLAFNPAGVPLTDWVGTPPDTKGSPGAGPLFLPER